MMQMLTYNSHTRCRAITNYKYVNDIIIRMTLRRDRLKITRQIPGKVIKTAYFNKYIKILVSISPSSAFLTPLWAYCLSKTPPLGSVFFPGPHVARVTS